MIALRCFLLLGLSGCTAEKVVPNNPYFGMDSAEVEREQRMLEEQKQVIAKQLSTLMKGEQEKVKQRIDEVSKRSGDTITLGVEDDLIIDIWLNSRISQQVGFPFEVKVPSDGRVFVPSIGEINFLGKSPSQLQKIIEEQASQILVNPVVKVNVIKHIGSKVTILGEVLLHSNRDSGPGVYEIDGETLLASFVSEAGGYTKDADISNIRVTSTDGLSKVVDMQRILDGHVEENVFLKGGETIYIPELSRMSYVIVAGHVGSPGVYPLEPGMRLSHLLAKAGGKGRTGTHRKVITVRGDRYHPQIIRSDLYKVYTQGRWDMDLVLEPGDTIYVPISNISFVEEVLRVVLLPVSTLRDFYFLDDQMSGDD
jgi:protein involved in polysaccharide export with SLBB domain